MHVAMYLQVKITCITALRPSRVKICCDKKRNLAAISLILIIDHSICMRNIWPITMFTTFPGVDFPRKQAKYNN